MLKCVAMPNAMLNARSNTSMPGSNAQYKCVIAVLIAMLHVAMPTAMLKSHAMLTARWNTLWLHVAMAVLHGSA